MNGLIEEWQQHAKRKENQNFDFLNWLKQRDSQNRVDAIAKESHEEVFSQIDCTKCANCCKTISPQVNKADIKRISAVLEISESEFIERYLKIDDENQYQMNSLPCPFLEDDKCSIYDVRPKDCQEYPHTNKTEFTHRRYLHISNTRVCPAVYHILETMKDRFNRRGKQQ